jgi:hypothetical protein
LRKKIKFIRLVHNPIKKITKHNFQNNITLKDEFEKKKLDCWKVKLKKTLNKKSKITQNTIIIIVFCGYGYDDLVTSFSVLLIKLLLANFLVWKSFFGKRDATRIRLKVDFKNINKHC